MLVLVVLLASSACGKYGAPRRVRDAPPPAPQPARVLESGAVRNAEDGAVTAQEPEKAEDNANKAPEDGDPQVAPQP